MGKYDLPMRFSDVTGNGRADYLCVEKDRRSWGCLNKADNSLTYISQTKQSEGEYRANIKLADINGNGKDGFLWVDKLTGDASVWYNAGQMPSTGSAFSWDARGQADQGAMQGTCLQFPDLDGNDRADMPAIDVVSNEATTWLNVFLGESTFTNGDDVTTLASPSLPFL